MRKSRLKIIALLGLVITIPSNIIAFGVMSEKKEFLVQAKNNFSVIEGDLKKINDEAISHKMEFDLLTSEANNLKVSLENARQKNPNRNEELKYAYLTFDDGPSQNTPFILDFLKENNIKATFFPVAQNNYQNSEEIYKRIVEEGHTLGIHSYSHDYAQIYINEQTLLDDLNKEADYLKSITGMRPTIARLPGGSTNTISNRYGGSGIMEKIRKTVLDAGYSYFDWNVDSGDALKFRQDKSVIVNNVISTGGLDLNTAVILMHDANPKTTTVEALPEIVEGLRKKGYVFKAITSDTEPVRYK